MSNINIAFSINDSYVKPLNTVVYSILENNPRDNFDIYILCNSLTNKNKRSIHKITELKNNVKIKIIEISKHKELFNDIRLTIDYISIETYYRYILADVLPNIDKILYLDADILVGKNISSLFNIDIDDYYIAAVKDDYITHLEVKNNRNKKTKYLKTIEFSDNDLYINAGVLLMNLNRMRSDNKIKELFDNTAKWGEKIAFQDQDIINITFKGDIKEIGNEFNYTDIAKRDEGKQPEEIVIIHYNGKHKPWNGGPATDYQTVYFEWYRRFESKCNVLLYGKDTRYALYTASTENIGDHIQSVAARRFLPRVDHRIERDRVGSWKNPVETESVKLITNGWYMHFPYQWPITDATINPMYVSMYIEQGNSNAVKSFLSNRSIDNFKKFGKVGARDEATYKFFKENGIEAYVSGCVTLTLQKDKAIKKQDFILLTDTSEAIYDYVKRNTNKTVIYLTNTASPDLDLETKDEIAELYLYLYQSASCVVTERLHTALPCLALETPVAFIKKENPIGGNINRLSGLDRLVHCYTEEEFTKGAYDINKPRRNKQDYKKYRESLIEKCQLFTKYNNKESFSWMNISRLTLNDVLSRIQYLGSVSTKRLAGLSVDRNIVLAENQSLRSMISEKQNEIDRLMGIKASARRLAGNIKRRLKKAVNESQ